MVPNPTVLPETLVGQLPKTGSFEREFRLLSQPGDEGDESQEDETMLPTSVEALAMKLQGTSATAHRASAMGIAAGNAIVRLETEDQATRREMETRHAHLRDLIDAQERRLAALEKTLSDKDIAHAREIEKLAGSVHRVGRWQTWVLGAGAGISAIAVILWAIARFFVEHGPAMVPRVLP